jgi:endonuclease I
MKNNWYRSFFMVSLLWSLTIILFSQPAGYYTTAEGKTGTDLQQALHDIIDNQVVLTYSGLWTSFLSTDSNADGKVWDIYSDIPGGTPAYVYNFGTNQCGNYDSEGDCYNREHSFPNSWFGGEVYPMYTDLFHIYPTDGYVNNKRGNYPYGTTGNPTWTSTNGSKLGPSSVSGYSGVVFEPVDAYKGDLARTYFYMATRYYGEDAGWPGSDMVTGSQPKEWALTMLMEWNDSDPVSQKELDRNDSAYVIQGNRNPFIDNPAYADLIWGNQTGTVNISEEDLSLNIYPNPTGDYLTIEMPFRNPAGYEVMICDVSGQLLMKKEYQGSPAIVDIMVLKNGLYIIMVRSGNKILRGKFIVSG